MATTDPREPTSAEAPTADPQAGSPTGPQTDPQTARPAPADAAQPQEQQPDQAQAARPASAAPLSAPARVGGPRRWWDWVLASDPGLGRLQAGWRAFVAMTVSLAVGYGMSHAVGVPAMLGMMAGGMMGLMSAFAVADITPLRLARSILWMVVPFAAVLPLSAWLHPHRALELSIMCVALGLPFLFARFGPLLMLTGMMLFNGFMVGTMLGVPVSTTPRLMAAAAVSAVAVLVARLLLCYPMPREDLLRTQRAFVVEARRVADAAADALDPDADADAAIRRMSRAQRRLNITTLTIDGQLALPEVASDPHAAELLHQHLFDAELALIGIGQAVQELARRHVPSALRESLVVGLIIARDTQLGRADALHPAAELIRAQAARVPEGLDVDDLSPEEAEVRALARRVGDLLDSLADSLASWLDLGNAASSHGRAAVPFQPTVALEGGRPAAGGPVLAKLVQAQGGEGWRRLVPVLRAPLHAVISAAIAVPIADAINPQKFYWGMIGVMVVLFGTSTTRDRLRKLAHRAVGTAVGAVIGIALVHLIGPGHVYPTLAVIVAGITLGTYGMQRAYAYWVVGLVAALCQMYALTTPLPKMDWLLTQRLIDNSMGFAVAIVIAALILPVSTRKVSREARRGYLSALEQLVAQLAVRWRDPSAPVRLRGAARGVEAALFQVQAISRPLVRMPMGVRHWGRHVGGRRGDEAMLGLLGTATRHAHALAAAADVDIDLPAALRDRVDQMATVFIDSLHALDREIATGGERGSRETWVRVAPLVREFSAALTGPSGPRTERMRRALNELAALDEVLAGLADNLGMPVTSVLPRMRATATHGAPAPSAGASTGATAAAAAAASDPAVVPAAASAPAPAPASAPAPVTAAAAAPASAPASARTAPRAAAVQGAVRCAAHPAGCEAWITVVDDRGKRRALVRAGGGRYAVNGLEPGGYTLVVSSRAHAPRADFLLVDRYGAEHDITLDPAR